MKWGIWVIGDDMGRGDTKGHWYKVTPTSIVRGFDSEAKAERHKLFMDETVKNCSRKCTHSVEEFEDEHTRPGSSVGTNQKEWNGITKCHPGGIDRDVLRRTESNGTPLELLDSKPKVWKKGM